MQNLTLDLPTPRANRRATDGAVLDAYKIHGTVWLAGRALGISGQAVHQRLNKLGIRRPPEFTEEQISHITSYYATTPESSFDLGELAASLNKSKANVCRMARKLGLTQQQRPATSATRNKLRAATVARHKKYPHPRGMLGKRHSPDVLAKISVNSKRHWSTWKAFGIGMMSPENREKQSARFAVLAALRPAESNYSRAKGGHREDLGGQYFRSSWEANYARYLNVLKRFGVVEEWEFEPETFWFPGIKRGATSYRPDFRIKYKGDEHLEYVEIKGWTVAKDRTKWKRMKKYHPSIRLIIVGAKDYYAIEKKWSSSIPEWERKKQAVRSAKGAGCP